ncbi:MAG: zinc metallopeptidase [Chloroflexi bacterium]|nr:zinc metallopeptidase [Chloroflexota bacterium]
MFYLDPIYFFFALPPLLLVLYAQFKVQSTYSKFLKTPNMTGITGAQAARRLLDASGLGYVGIDGAPGELSDHYDPSQKVLRLSSGVAYNASVASLGIVAHEVGHAVQDQRAFLPMQVRTGLVPIVNLGTTLGYIFFLAGIFLQFTGLVWAGVGLFSLGFVFTVVTLPVELNASSRALALLRNNGLVSTTELAGARAVLDAAALTYVAAMAQALGNLLYYVFLALGMGRRND